MDVVFFAKVDVVVFVFFGDEGCDFQLLISTVFGFVFIGRIEDDEEVFFWGWCFDAAKMYPMLVVDGMNMNLRIAGPGVSFALEAIHRQRQELFFFIDTEVAEFWAIELLSERVFGVFAKQFDEFLHANCPVVEFILRNIGQYISVGAPGQFES